MVYGNKFLNYNTVSEPTFTFSENVMGLLENDIITIDDIFAESTDLLTESKIGDFFKAAIGKFKEVVKKLKEIVNKLLDNVIDKIIDLGMKALDGLNKFKEKLNKSKVNKESSILQESPLEGKHKYTMEELEKITKPFDVKVTVPTNAFYDLIQQLNLNMKNYASDLQKEIESTNKIIGTLDKTDPDSEETKEYIVSVYEKLRKEDKDLLNIAHDILDKANLSVDNLTTTTTINCKESKDLTDSIEHIKKIRNELKNVKREIDNVDENIIKHYERNIQFTEDEFDNSVSVGYIDILKLQLKSVSNFINACNTVYKILLDRSFTMCKSAGRAYLSICTKCNEDVDTQKYESLMHANL
jgi:hypothetical protein